MQSEPLSFIVKDVRLKALAKLHHARGQVLDHAVNKVGAVAGIEPRRAGMQAVQQSLGEVVVVVRLARRPSVTVHVRVVVALVKGRHGLHGCQNGRAQQRHARLRVGREGHAGANLAEIARLLVQPDRHVAPQQTQRRRHANDATADDCHTQPAGLVTVVGAVGVLNVCTGLHRIKGFRSPVVSVVPTNNNSSMPNKGHRLLAQFFRVN